ncbi:MAG: ribonuclease H-like domain-containing protein [Patescibacteria group bacterium]
MDYIVFDIETKNSYISGGSFIPEQLDLSIICIYDSQSDEYYSFLEDELHKLWPFIEKTEMLIGYNSDHFDIPLLNKYYNGDLTHIKSLDLLKEIKDSLNRRVSLDQVAEGTLGRKKIASGIQAVKWYQEGNLDSLRKYCLEDVKITKEIYDYALQHQHLKFKEAGKIFDIKLDTSTWNKKEDGSMTFSLPF